MSVVLIARCIQLAVDTQRNRELSSSVRPSVQKWYCGLDRNMYANFCEASSAGWT